MAKASKSTRKSKRAASPKSAPAPAPAQPADPAAAASGSATGSASTSNESKTRLLDQLGEALLNIGSEAKRIGQAGVATVGKYGKIGLTSADLEREKIALRGAYADLGEKIVGLWDDSPMATVRAGDREVEGEMEKIKHLRQRVSELREKINTIRSEQPQV